MITRALLFYPLFFIIYLNVPLTFVFKKYFLREKSKVELEMEVVLKTNQNLEESVREMRQSLKSLNVAIESMSTAVRQLSIERVSLFYFFLNKNAIKHRQ